MGTYVKPQVFLIAETKIDEAGLEAAFGELGVPGTTIAGTSDAERLTEFAGKSCYMSFDTSLNKNLTRTGTRANAEYIEQQILAPGHGSVLEHSTVSFMLVNVSRVVTHELVRHRAGTAFSQTSGRYVRLDEIDMVLPMSADIPARDEVYSIFDRAMEQQEQNLADLVRVTQIDEKPFGMKKRLTSLFRRLIGNGQANNILVTANHRAWRHIIAMRTSEHAEAEIRLVIGAIAEVLKNRYPAIYVDMVKNEYDEWEFSNPKV